MAYVYMPGVPSVAEKQKSEAWEYLQRVSREESFLRTSRKEDNLRKIMAENKGWKVVHLEIHKGERWGDDLTYVRLRRGFLWWKKEKLVFLSDRLEGEGRP